MKRDLTLTLRDACAARGLDPASYKVPSKAHRNVERIIPGVADSKSPSEVSAKHLGANYHGNARRQYTWSAAQTDLSHLEQARIAGEETACYVAAFERLNNLRSS